MSIDINIKKKLGNFTLDLSFTAENDILALLGASGCGKSLTLKCIAGIESPDQGYIIVNGRTLFDSEKKINLKPQQRKVGYMFQDYALFPNMTVEKNICAGIRKKISAYEIDNILQKYHIEDLKDKYPAQLSGGQKQRVALARMLCSEPDILLFDEPLSALDTFLKWQVEEELIETLDSINKTCIYVTHSRDEVYHLCNKVCLINDGHVDVYKGKKAFFSDPETLAAAKISGCKNLSPSKSIADDRIYASDWNIALKCNSPIESDISWVGIRAHYINVRPLNPEEESDKLSATLDDNTKLMTVMHVLEQQFEIELLLKNSPDSLNHIRAYVPKNKISYYHPGAKVLAHIPADALFLLKNA